MTKQFLTTIHQINLHKSKYANYELFKQIEPLINFAALTQEPHVFKGKLTGMPRGLKSHLSGPNPRSCIIWPKKLNITPITDFCTEDVISCLWETNSTMRTKVMLISVYWDILAEGVPEKLVACLDYCKTHKIPYLCSMDSNAHSSLWAVPLTTPGVRPWRNLLSGLGLIFSTLALNPLSLIVGTQPSLTSPFLIHLFLPLSPTGGSMTPPPSLITLPSG